MADKVPERVAEQIAPVGGNIGEAQSIDLSAKARYTSLDDLLAHEGLQVVDICTPTDLHADMTVKALEAGKHVICEKPMARSVEECSRMIDAARANDRMLFIAQCIRFWPEYEVLATMVKNGDLGRIISARFTRLSPPPTWAESGWLMDEARGGGALLDLHIHDVDFLLSVFGRPRAVSTIGADALGTGKPVDHVCTQYLYDDLMCYIECGWPMPPSYPFEMAFQVLGEKGILVFSTSADPTLTWYPAEGDPSNPQVAAGTGYDREMAYFFECIEKGVMPERISPEEAREAVELVMAEERSVTTGRPVSL